MIKRDMGCSYRIPPVTASKICISFRDYMPKYCPTQNS